MGYSASPVPTISKIGTLIMANIDFQEAYKKIRPSIVGLGFRKDPEYKIIGTGFIIHPSGWIMTNKHVINTLLDTSNDGRAAACLFVKAQPEAEFVNVSARIVTDINEAAIPPSEKLVNQDNMKKTYRGLNPRQIIPPEPLDIGVCKINATSLPKESLPLIPANIIHSKEVIEGAPVGILGFPQGLSFPAKFDSQGSIQMTPLLQTGVISGILPFSGLPNPTSFVLDLHVNLGSSGSPLFLSNGNVIGLVYATRQSFEPLKSIGKDGNLESSQNSGVYLPTSLGLAVPSARFPKEWLSK